MRVSFASALCSLVALSAARPYNGTNSAHCISDDDAVLIADGFGQILSNYSESFGNKLIAEGYIDQSDSVATLMHSPNVVPSHLGVITFDTKASFLAGEAAQPGVPFELLNTWHSCNAVTFRYVLHPPGLDVQGIAVAEVEQSKNGTGVGESSQKWQIKTFYGEFNSAVWLTDLKSQACNVTANVTAAA